MDDGYAVGPADVVFRAVQGFGMSVREIGLELQETKCECYCPAGADAMAGHRPSLFPLGTCRDAHGTAHGFGVPVGGVPL
eukprot:11284304-Karenia_brevis.AAC.1